MKKAHAHSYLLTLILVSQVITLIKPDRDKFYCSTVITRLEVFHFHINCDSPIFLLDAQNPQRLINGESVYADRPIYSLLNHLVLRFLEVIRFPTHEIEYFGQDGKPVNYLLENYAIYIAINLTILIFTAYLAFLITNHLIISRQLGSMEVYPTLTFLILLISMNKLTHDFFWSPHTQMFNVMIPISLIAIAMLGGNINNRETAIVVVTISILTLAYPLSAIMGPVLAISVRHGSLIKKICITIAPLVPYFVWPQIVVALGGTYRNNSIDSEQFVWILNAQEEGKLLLRCRENLLAMMSTFPKIAVCCVIIYWLAQIFVSKRKGIRALNPFSSEECKNLLIGFMCYLTFLYLMGDYYPRLSWGPVIFLIVLTILHATSRYGDSKLVRKLMIVGALIWIAIWIDPNFQFG